jgi:hypothetical protein
MNDHSAAEAGLNTFDGDTISRADREFLASLSDHPLARDPLYSVPPPPRDEKRLALQGLDQLAQPVDLNAVDKHRIIGAFVVEKAISNLCQLAGCDQRPRRRPSSLRCRTRR